MRTEIWVVWTRSSTMLAFISKSAEPPSRIGSALDARLEVVRAILETNLIGPFALSQGIIALMRDQGHGRVVIGPILPRQATAPLVTPTWLIRSIDLGSRLHSRFPHRVRNEFSAASDQRSGGRQDRRRPTAQVPIIHCRRRENVIDCR